MHRYEQQTAGAGQLPGQTTSMCAAMWGFLCSGSGKGVEAVEVYSIWPDTDDITVSAQSFPAIGFSNIKSLCRNHLTAKILRIGWTLRPMPWVSWVNIARKDDCGRLDPKPCCWSLSFPSSWKLQPMSSRNKFDDLWFLYRWAVPSSGAALEEATNVQSW